MFDEAILEPLARKARFSKGLKHISLTKPLEIVDLGCGPQIRFYHFAKERRIKIKHYTGIDPLVSDLVVRSQQAGKVTIINKPLSKQIRLKSRSADIVTAFAFFEHIDHPKEILKEAYRLLKPEGKLILTVPSYRAKAVLEFLAFRLKLISVREIAEHKQYFDHYKLIKLLPLNVKRPQTYHEYFELGMNNLFVVEK